jgi:predicted TPR repeat methyltransferase
MENNSQNNFNNAPTAPFQKVGGNRAAGVIDEFLEVVNQPKQLWQRLTYRFKNAPEFNYELAQELADNGRFKDALIRLKINLWLSPNHFKSHYLKGCCHIALDDQVKAKAAFLRAAELNPSDVENNFMLASLDPYIVPSERQPTTMPLKIALNYFGGIADNYEATQAQASYRGHQLADQAVWDSLNRRRHNYEVLDLGCGTGLCGVLLAEHADYIVGVDFCQEMLDIAASKRRPNGQRIYTEAINQDLRLYLADCHKPRFDAITAAHVFNYVGELIWVFDGVARALKEGGVFVFQVERYANEGYYGLLGGFGRFGHSDTYIRNHVARVGLHLTAVDLVQVFPEYQLVQYVVRKAPFDVD